MDHSIQRLNYTAIRLLENTKQTDVNTAQNGTTHVYEELQNSLLSNKTWHKLSSNHRHRRIQSYAVVTELGEGA